MKLSAHMLLGRPQPICCLFQKSVHQQQQHGISRKRGRYLESVTSSMRNPLIKVDSQTVFEEEEPRNKLASFLAESAIKSRQWQSEPEAKPAGRQRVVDKSRSPKVIDETDPGRTSFHQQLLKVALSGNSKNAEMILEEMERAGFLPGPRAFHALIVAYAKEGNGDGALHAIRRVFQQEQQPLSESYAVVIHAFMQSEGNAELAEKVLESAQRSAEAVAGKPGRWQPVDVQPAWRMLVHDLFKAGLHSKAEEHYQQGRKLGFVPNADVMAVRIEYLCQLRVEEKLDEANDLLEEMQDLGLELDARHVNPIIQARFERGETTVAMELLEEFDANVESFNGLLEGLLRSTNEQLVAIREERLEALLESWAMQMDAREIIANAKTYVLTLELYLKSGRPLLERGVLAWKHALRTPEIRKVLNGSPTIELFFNKLSEEGRPSETLQYLWSMKIRRLRFPDQASSASKQPTFISSWLRAANREAPDIRTYGLAAKNEQLLQAVEEVEGVAIGAGKCAVDKNGGIIPASRLTPQQLRSELLARGLSTVGKRTELYKRVQAARRSLPADFLSKTKKMAAKKSVRNDAVREKLSQELSQGMFRTFFADGSMEPNKDEEEDDSLIAEVSFDVDPMENIDLEIGLDLDEGMDKKGKLPPAMPRRLLTQDHIDAALIKDIVAAAAGCGFNLSVGDCMNIVQVAEAENCGYLAYSAVEFWKKIIGDFDEDTLANLYRSCIDICLSVGEPEMAEQILLDMVRQNIPSDAELTERVSEALLEGTDVDDV